MRKPFHALPLREDKQTRYCTYLVNILSIMMSSISSTKSLLSSFFSIICTHGKCLQISVPPSHILKDLKLLLLLKVKKLCRLNLMIRKSKSRLDINHLSQTKVNFFMVTFMNDRGWERIDF